MATFKFEQTPVALDTTLSKEDYAADAKAVGDKFDVHLGHINALSGRAYNLEGRAAALEAADTGIKARLDSLEQGGSGGTVELDASLTNENMAAQAKAVGDRLDVLEDRPLVLIDPYLSQPNYAADAKAVGQKFNEYATKTYVDSAVANSGGGGGASIGTYSANLAYTLKDNGEYEVSGIGTCTDTHIVIPSIINSVKVTSIGDEAFSDCLNIVGVTIPNSVTVIGAKAFLACEKLERVAIPDSVTTIGQQAFSYCSKLASVTIPKSVTTIAKHAFLYSYQNSLTIYCEASSQPSGWDADWNADNFPVVWGAALDFASVNAKLGSGGNTGGGGASGGLSIKKIEFTDRPSAYEWLCNNADKVIKTTLVTNQVPAPVNYNTMLTAYSADGSDLTFEVANTILSVNTNGSSQLSCTWARIRGSSVEVMMIPKHIGFETDNSLRVEDGAPTTVPDAYWAAMAVALTFYYID